ncbi:efflux RND transporter periplasmic adaptor subunit [Bradyrhizobium sp. U87765 SZCCT0131]|uniref:efflux RND transporter periplasmic adaptor subunit n=1 Tax=unclassified Bradyrhizobium TaxID=2631580 RepID=UPI001BAA90C9|nr:MULTISPECIES: efflux RND transporter periplasmic adaptor subunit [unclassified Bradyrhizobium]MBR1218283.1 efflux RND transporter periplasmic adaptor subunit [Bradyrhizobium sp. U87765 SZCCT0131]MBR1260771.1 efflux RND transporter periplasmic adaptor subunit [Bradyrhizobium sp. U87765 SZCCT0134]MBR1303781.1 efflux RND transporter periplasmic adaptor subunit [Bradyrhizobium sp. U87765 SZCCT0110]MBR1319387.1 efflux RND transporter periplasmic adaptor subunit [Bradyrhizobium sp. U87765 SZCCT010
MSFFSHFRAVALGTVFAGALIGAGVLFVLQNSPAKANNPGAAPVPAVPVSVATVEQRAAPTWDEFSGRLEAVERVEVRPRVAGVIEAVHFREGALVKQGDLLFSIDPAPYAAEVERNKAQVLAIQARIAMTRNDLERGQQLWDSRTISQRDLDQRLNAQREAEANLRAAEAALTSAQLNLDYTSVKAPVAGRVGKIEVTVGNLVAAGPGSPVLTSLVSINPIYASFNADERAVMRALKSQPAGANGLVALDRIPVQMGTVLSDGTPFAGHLQLIDNQVDARSGTVRVRAVFDNADGKLMPGQFARVRMGHAESQQALVISERAIGTDQDKKFVMVVGPDNRANYREVKLGETSEGLRMVAGGLKAGERIVVNGLQRVKPGSVVEPTQVSMDGSGERSADAAAGVSAR